MATKSQLFRGTPHTAALSQPCIAPAHPGSELGVGVPWGIDLRTGKVLLVDGWGLRELGILNGLVGRLDGIRESGKTTMLKALALRMMGLQAGLDENGYPVPFRLRITDQKPEDGKPEYSALTKALYSEVIQPTQSGKINPFDPSMSDLVSMLETAVNLSETVLGRPLRNFEPLAHQVAVSKMYNNYRHNASPNLLEGIFRRLKPQDVEDYYSSHDAELLEQVRLEQSDDPNIMQQLQLLVREPNNIPRAAFEQDAAQMAASMTELLHGDYGNLFGQGLSIRELLSQQVATIDRTGMNLKSRIIFESLMWRWQTWALVHNQLDLIPHLNLGDEEHDSYQSLMYLRSYDDYVRKARAYHTWDMKATQYSGRLNKIGAEGSEARELAASINLGVSMRIIGKQPDDPEVLQDLSELGLSDEDADFCTELEQGCFGLKVPNRKVIFFQFILTPLELELVQSNAANRRMMQRANVMSFETIRERAEKLGHVQLEDEEHDQTSA